MLGFLLVVLPQFVWTGPVCYVFARLVVLDVAGEVTQRLDARLEEGGPIVLVAVCLLQLVFQIQINEVVLDLVREQDRLFRRTQLL